MRRIAVRMVPVLTTVSSAMIGDPVDSLPGAANGCLVCGEEIVVTP